MYSYYNIIYSFLKVGNSPKMSPTDTDGNNMMHANNSWRQTILSRVVTPSKDHNAKENEKIENIDIIKSSNAFVKRKTKQELRDLWKKAINQQLILIRMEKENAKLRGRDFFLYRLINRIFHSLLNFI